MVIGARRRWWVVVDGVGGVGGGMRRQCFRCWRWRFRAGSTQVLNGQRRRGRKEREEGKEERRRVRRAKRTWRAWSSKGAEKREFMNLVEVNVSGAAVSRLPLNNLNWRRGGNMSLLKVNVCYSLSTTTQQSQLLHEFQQDQGRDEAPSS